MTAFYGLLKKGLKDEPPTPKVGEPFKHAVTGKVHYVAWTDGDLYWVTTGEGRYGYLGPIEPWRKYASESKARSGAPGTNGEGWKVGDRLTQGQGRVHVEIIAVTDKSVLLIADGESRPYPEPNDQISRFYSPEIKPVKLF